MCFFFRAVDRIPSVNMLQVALWHIDQCSVYEDEVDVPLSFSGRCFENALLPGRHHGVCSPLVTLETTRAPSCTSTKRVSMSLPSLPMGCGARSLCNP